jgi:hypothetical protein
MTAILNLDLLAQAWTFGCEQAVEQVGPNPTFEQALPIIMTTMLEETAQQVVAHMLREQRRAYKQG